MRKELIRDDVFDWKAFEVVPGLRSVVNYRNRKTARVTIRAAFSSWSVIDVFPLRPFGQPIAMGMSKGRESLVVTFYAAGIEVPKEAIIFDGDRLLEGVQVSVFYDFRIGESAEVGYTTEVFPIYANDQKTPSNNPHP